MAPSFDIERISAGPGRRIVVVAPRRVDKAEVDALADFIAAEAPDALCLGTDDKRHQWTAPAGPGDSIDLVGAIRRGQAALMWSYLMLIILARRFIRFGDSRPGRHMHAAEQAAAEVGADVVTVDRAMDRTCVRAWRTSSRWQRAKLVWLLTWGLFSRPSNEPMEPAAAIRPRLDARIPRICEVVFDESSQYMAKRIAETPGNKLLVVASPAHYTSLVERLDVGPIPADIAALDHVKPKSLLARIAPWVLTAALIGLFAAGFAFGDTDKMTDAALAWVLCNSILAAVGAIASLAHPITIAAVALTAPIVSLNPAVGAGMVGLFVQALVVPPTLHDMERVGADLVDWTGWWQNPMARLMVIFVLANLGSTVGSFLALAWFPDVF